jgi:hypothetical protein
MLRSTSIPLAAQQRRPVEAMPIFPDVRPAALYRAGELCCQIVQKSARARAESGVDRHDVVEEAIKTLLLNS